MVREVVAGGGTNLGGGLQQGINVLARTMSNGNQHKMILISDGLANQGITDPSILWDMAGGAYENRFSISTVGVGYDFNEILMTGIADHGAGQYYFLENPNAFAKVFEQTYTRFLDLKKAEAQAREAQIEAALERVRTRSMAMHNSDELADLSFELVKQVHSLGIETWFCAFNIYDEDRKDSLEWGSNTQGTYSEYRTPREGIFLQY